MPKLIKAGAVVDNDNIEFRPLDEWRPGQALLLQVDDEPGDQLVGASEIAIHFGAFNDGRGLSLAVLLRTRFGFTGDLRAVGDVHHDLVHYLVRCGFSSFELPEGRDVDVALRGANVYSRYYQGSVANPAPLAEQLKEVA